eukprot:gb/GEZN01011776.1/.p2 GENE.gb/GEZN01011776.1/~~gb/GEZN01011776.1/.p2  ORF type:complete len:121 (+),score=15.40 gb/GEZN01011776.1/:350-712(+)
MECLPEQEGAVVSVPLKALEAEVVEVMLIYRLTLPTLLLIQRFLLVPFYLAMEEKEAQEPILEGTEQMVLRVLPFCIPKKQSELGRTGDVFVIPGNDCSYHEFAVRNLQFTGSCCIKASN